MKNKDNWKPSKYEYFNGHLKASNNPEEVSITSRLIVNIIARFYDSEIKNNVNGKLLDLGCGKVPLYHAYRNFITENICIDWNNSFHKNQYIDYSVNLNMRLPFDDNQFDTIILSDVLEHVNNPSLLLCETFRILKNQGKLILNVPFFYWLHEEPYDYYRYTKYSLQMMIQNCGYKIIKLEAGGGVIEILTDIMAKIIIKLPILGTFLAVSIQKVTDIFIQTKIGKKISSKSSVKFPFLYFLIAQKETSNEK